MCEIHTHKIINQLTKKCMRVFLTDDDDLEGFSEFQERGIGSPQLIQCVLMEILRKPLRWVITGRHQLGWVITGRHQLGWVVPVQVLGKYEQLSQYGKIAFYRISYIRFEPPFCFLTHGMVYVV